MVFLIIFGYILMIGLIIFSIVKLKIDDVDELETWAIGIFWPLTLVFWFLPWIIVQTGLYLTGDENVDYYFAELIDKWKK